MRHLVGLLSGSASISPHLFHPNEEAERKGHDAWKPPGSALCSPAKQGQHGFKRNSVASSTRIILPRSNRASLGDTSHDIGRKQQPSVCVTQKEGPPQQLVVEICHLHLLQHLLAPRAGTESNRP